MEISTKRHDQKNLPGGISVLLNTFEGALREVPVNVAMDFFFSSVLKVGFKKLLDNFSIQSFSSFFLVHTTRCPIMNQKK